MYLLFKMNNKPELEVLIMGLELLDETKLSEDHKEYLWIDPKNYKNYNLIENLIPAFEDFLNN